VYYRKEKIEKDKKRKKIGNRMKQNRLDVDWVKYFWLCIKKGGMELLQIREKYVEGNTYEGKKPPQKGVIAHRDMTTQMKPKKHSTHQMMGHSIQSYHDDELLAPQTIKQKIS
jgi:hypothetical protein